MRVGPYRGGEPRLECREGGRGGREEGEGMKGLRGDETKPDELVYGLRIHMFEWERVGRV